jgi:hypothetical protein
VSDTSSSSTITNSQPPKTTIAEIVRKIHKSDIESLNKKSKLIGKMVKLATEANCPDAEETLFAELGDFYRQLTTRVAQGQKRLKKNPEFARHLIRFVSVKHINLKR